VPVLKRWLRVKDPVGAQPGNQESRKKGVVIRGRGGFFTYLAGKDNWRLRNSERKEESTLNKVTASLSFQERGGYNLTPGPCEKNQRELTDYQPEISLGK